MTDRRARSSNLRRLVDLSDELSPRRTGARPDAEPLAALLQRAAIRLMEHGGDPRLVSDLRSRARVARQLEGVLRALRGLAVEDEGE